MITNKLFGNKGEDTACKYLKSKGYEIICRNYRSAFGEIDIICSYKNITIFVEVKNRSSETFGKGYEAVNIKKQSKIIKTAQVYTTENNIDNICRFDIISIDSNNISHIENAFY